ncbi:MAG: hypothetical protein OEM02_02835 [Desulfobulbaceae bacterium]|nr:hypothetical protein [Desulfobulbaceae bacterium]
MIHENKRIFHILILILFTFLSTSCVDKKDIEDLSKRIFQKEENLSALRDEVKQLTVEIKSNQEKLYELEGKGKGESVEAQHLEEILHDQTAREADLNRRITKTEEKTQENERRIMALETSQKNYNNEIQKALEENKKLKSGTREKILEIEDNYRSKRQKSANIETNEQTQLSREL